MTAIEIFIFYIFYNFLQINQNEFNHFFRVHAKVTVVVPCTSTLAQPGNKTSDFRRNCLRNCLIITFLVCIDSCYALRLTAYMFELVK